jgi:hypothetical protein
MGYTDGVLHHLDTTDGRDILAISVGTSENISTSVCVA